jgi:amino acid transporter
MAAGPKKFGAFSGVFTPSILTILGVIMYLRLGWVAGVSGLVGVIAIIFLAHIISFTTGLSISSIATDKKIKAGGIYYILSRSLGLPMGGSIGITLFVGTALSISMYIVGFTESFLAIPAIAHWIESLGLTVGDMDTVRIIGSAVLVLLVIIAFISTDIAIKTQFLILTAIALSLISVFVGFFVHPEFAPKGDMMDYQPFKDFSFEVVFAVFFPAVTGFTAGVAMSGDLKDPKKDIPKGTMWAIIIGFVVYLALGISFVLLVDKNILLHDYNFLMKLAWIPALVVAGIWGATLSSALGGILGGPRILQAIAKDRIVPKTLGKGYGINNEPRNALILTFFISEMGVLVGDLNIIAGIVTMFYLTAYGFINLAFSLEKWASTDFRPTFRVPVWVGVIGFVVSFMIMFKLDMVSMFVALLILLGIYYYISRKSLNFRGSDVWQSVYISLVKSILKKLNELKPDERNWRPNILLFSGGTKTRPHLIEFGKAIVAKKGIISNFDLIENKASEVFFSRNKLSDEEKKMEISEGIFTRRQECKDVYTGIEIISAVYGFSGIEPNTVLLGWGRQSEEPVRFVKMIKQISDLDLNVVLLDYDKKREFGNRQLIDVWWRGGSNNGNLMLALIRFIKSTFEWRNARVRIMIVNPVNENRALIERDATQVLLNMRIDAEIRVINNEIEKRHIYDIIKQESVNSDLIFLGIPDVVKNKEKEFIETIDKLCKDIGTTVLVKASSMFKELHIGILPGQFRKQAGREAAKPKALPRLNTPVSAVAALEMIRVYEDVTEIIDKALAEDLSALWTSWDAFLEDIKKTWQTYYTGLHKKITEYDKDLRIFTISQNLQLVAKIKRQIRDFEKNNLVVHKEKVENLVSAFAAVKAEIEKVIPDNLIIEYTSAEIKMLKAAGKLSSSDARALKKRKKFEVKFKKVKEQVILNGLPEAWLEMLKELDYRTFEVERSFNRLLGLIEDYQPGKYYSHLEMKKAMESLKQKEESFNKILRNLQADVRETEKVVTDVVYGEIIRLFNKCSILLETPSSMKKFSKVRISGRKARGHERLINKFPAVWNNNRQLTLNITFASIYLLSLKLRLRSMIIEDISVVRKVYDAFKRKVLMKFEKSIIEYRKSVQEKGEVPPFEFQALMPENLKEEIEKVYEVNKKSIDSFLKEFPEKIVLFNDKKYNHYKEYEFSKETTTEVRFSMLVSFIIQDDLFDPLKKALDGVVSGIGDEVEQINGRIDRIRVMTKNKKRKDRHELIGILEETKEDIEQMKAELLENRKNLEMSLSERLNAVWDKLRISTLTIQNEVLYTRLREYKERQKKGFLGFLKKK